MDMYSYLRAQVNLVPGEESLGPTCGGSEVWILLLDQSTSILAYVLHCHTLSPHQYAFYPISYFLIKLS